jgi:hypothetical protein
MFDVAPQAKKDMSVKRSVTKPKQIDLLPTGVKYEKIRLATDEEIQTGSMTIFSVVDGARQCRQISNIALV